MKKITPYEKAGVAMERLADSIGYDIDRDPVYQMLTYLTVCAEFENRELDDFEDELFWNVYAKILIEIRRWRG